jgi:hypothetical protein
MDDDLRAGDTSGPLGIQRVYSQRRPFAPVWRGIPDVRLDHVDDEVAGGDEAFRSSIRAHGAREDANARIAAAALRFASLDGVGAVLTVERCASGCSSARRSAATRASWACSA